MDLLVVGAGRMGRWFARTVVEGVDRTVSPAFADADPAAARAAAADLDARAVALDGEGRFDAVCLAVPMGAVADAVERHAPRAERAVCDVAGAMEPAVTAMAAAAPDRERLSLHPLFAPANAPGNVAAVPDATGPTTDAIRSALVTRGNEVVETTPGEHDRAMETVQAKAHAAVLAFGLAAEDVPPGLSTPVHDALADVLATVVGNDPRVYADVQAAFDGADDVAAAAGRIADADPAAFERLYREAGGEDGGDG
jgi:prephenate dehydrogenase